ncbi:hypothetical protein PCE1_001539 [Barthelona sp. PCE]
MIATNFTCDKSTMTATDRNEATVKNQTILSDNILLVKASPNAPDFSNSYDIAFSLVTTIHPYMVDSSHFTLLDLAHESIPAVTDDFLNSNPAELEEVKHLAKKIWGHDGIVIISTPMMNFNVPANLKQLIDVTIQAGLNFCYTEQGPEGLMNPEKTRIFLCISSGGIYDNERRAYDHVKLYLEQIADFVGLKVEKTFWWGGTSMPGAQERKRALLDEMNDYFE